MARHPPDYQHLLLGYKISLRDTCRYTAAGYFTTPSTAASCHIRTAYESLSELGSI
jgi:hypothetical protein